MRSHLSTRAPAALAHAHEDYNGMSLPSTEDTARALVVYSTIDIERPWIF